MKFRISWYHLTKNFDLGDENIKDFDNEQEAWDFRRELLEDPTILVSIVDII